MKENSIGDRIKEKYTRYINCETDILELTIEEAIFILEKDASVHYVEDLLQEAYKVILSDYKRVLKENNRLEEQVEYDKTHIYTSQTIELNFISKSKIEDKIKKINDVSNAEELEDIMNRKNYTIVELVQYVLQELLERRK